MTSPKPVSLTQIAADQYSGQDPQPLVVVGPIPGGGAGAVDSVNGKTGVVVLGASDVGALPSSTPIPDSPDDIGAATAAQGAKADTAVQPAGLTKAAVGLGNVDNTSDANKPVSTAQQTAINGRVIALNGLTSAWLGTQAQYDAISPKDSATVYFVKG
ncbi:hypothetical protein [Streptomyces sp. AC495_CC817]|uniref:phage upper tail fiber protein n=1 Tax=Streptomyces sp. AC495_CC817 TaxID=2823900 RepID=UPI001C262C7F|nr:hypothetical protein [Streptomyces sp. AC495_CC817]